MAKKYKNHQQECKKLKILNFRKHEMKKLIISNCVPYTKGVSMHIYNLFPSQVTQLMLNLKIV